MLVQHRRIKNRFTHAEDAIITSMMKSKQNYSWHQIGEALKGRSARQVKERWLNYLDPNLNQDNWSSEEEKLLLEKIREIGHKWRLIAKYFKGRTDVHLKNHYNLMIRKSIRLARTNSIKSLNKNQLTPQLTEKEKDKEESFICSSFSEDFTFEPIEDDEFLFCDCNS